MIKDLINQVKCTDCFKFYIGQISTNIKIRIQNYKNNLKPISKRTTVLSVPPLHWKHKIDYVTVKMLHKMDQLQPTGLIKPIGLWGLYEYSVNYDT